MSWLGVLQRQREVVGAASSSPESGTDSTMLRVLDHLIDIAADQEQRLLALEAAAR